MDKDELKTRISEAFSGTEYPGDWCLKGSTEGTEPFLLEKEFKGRTDWRVLTPEFLDQAPDGYGSALSFFSDEAFRFYLPAYLISDIDGKLEQCDVVYHLTHGLDDISGKVRINPKRYGERTWLDYVRYKFSMFTASQCCAISKHLAYKAESPQLSDNARAEIAEAREHYWEPRCREGQ